VRGPGPDLFAERAQALRRGSGGQGRIADRGRRLPRTSPPARSVSRWRSRASAGASSGRTCSPVSAGACCSRRRPTNVSPAPASSRCPPRPASRSRFSRACELAARARRDAVSSQRDHAADPGGRTRLLCPYVEGSQFIVKAALGIPEARIFCGDTASGRGTRGDRARPALRSPAIAAPVEGPHGGSRARGLGSAETVHTLTGAAGEELLAATPPTNRSAGERRPYNSSTSAAISRSAVTSPRSA